jgi:hypothetical protein
VLGVRDCNGAGANYPQQALGVYRDKLCYVRYPTTLVFYGRVSAIISMQAPLPGHRHLRKVALYFEPDVARQSTRGLTANVHECDRADDDDDAPL